MYMLCMLLKSNSNKFIKLHADKIKKIVPTTTARKQKKRVNQKQQQKLFNSTREQKKR